MTAAHRTDLLQPGLAGPQPAASIGSALGSAIVLQLYLIPAALLFLVGYGVSHAATVDAVNCVGHGLPTSVRISLLAVRGRWLRWSGIVLRQLWSAAWPMMPGLALLVGAVAAMALPGAARHGVIAGGVMVLAIALITTGVITGVLNFIRNTLAIAAGVTENLRVNDAMRRSRALTAGRKGRLFLAWMLEYALQMVVAAVQMPLLFAAMTLRGASFVAVQAVLLLVQFVAVALVTPVASIAFTLFYVDERVRREGYDIEMLMRQTLPAAVSAHAGDR